MYFAWDLLVGKWAWAKLKKSVHSTVHMISCLYCTVQLTGDKTQKMLEDDGNGLDVRKRGPLKIEK